MKGIRLEYQGRPAGQDARKKMIHKQPTSCTGMILSSWSVGLCLMVFYGIEIGIGFSRFGCGLSLVLLEILAVWEIPGISD